MIPSNKGQLGSEDLELHEKDVDHGPTRERSRLLEPAPQIGVA